MTQPTSSPASVDPEALRGQCVMVVEDDRVLRFYVRHILEGMGGCRWWRPAAASRRSCR